MGKGQSAGGCVNNPKTWPLNPQIKLEVPRPSLGAQIRMVVSLMQPDARMKFIADRDCGGEWAVGQGVFKQNIGFMMFKCKPDGKPMHFADGKLLVAQAAYEARREVQCQLDNVEPGTYYIVPSTFYPGKET